MDHVRALRQTKLGHEAGGSEGRRFLEATTTVNLVQRSIDRSELGIELGAEPVHDGDDGKRNAGCDQAILDGGRAGFVSKKSADGFHRTSIDLKRKGVLNRRW